MKKFNKSKVIIPALAMIALSTAASATGTVAWFAANSAVTATGMSFTASASANLFIGKDTTEKTISNINDLVSSTVDLSTSFGAIKPCTLEYATETNTEAGTVAGTVTVKNATAYSTTPSYNNAGVASSYEKIGTITAANSNNNTEPDPDKDLDDHIAHAHVKIARKQNPKAYFALTPKVTLTFVKTSPLNKALRAAWIIGTDAIGYSYQQLVGNVISEQFVAGMSDSQYDTGSAEFTGTKVEHLPDNTLIDVALMVWYEGSDEDCKTEGAINIAGCSAEWSFTSTDSTQA